jgi:hypothetical protein
MHPRAIPYHNEIGHDSRVAHEDLQNQHILLMDKV